MTQFRQTAVGVATAAALVAGAGLASAQTTIITQEPTVQAPDSSQTVVTTTAPAPLRLTQTQRQTVYRTIVRDKVAPAQAAVAYRVGTRVPESTRLYAVPEEVAVEVPAVRTYKYMVVNGQVLLVDPATSQVVAELAD